MGQWQPGQSGNPNGSAVRTKPWKDALRRAIKRQQELGLVDGRVFPMLTERRDENGNLICTTREDGIIIVPAGQALELIADMTVQQSLCGDVAARKEIGDRLDGRPPQTIEGGDIPLITAVKWIDDNVTDVDKNGNPEEE
jgi:Family of unknown function (DUF5681)